MIRAYRICQERHADTAFDGEGARLHGGRWNHKGTPMIYLAGSVALAQLEMLVHLDSDSVLMGRYVVIAVDIPEDVIVDAGPAAVPENWDSRTGRQHTADTGDCWFRAKQSAVLKVPSAVVPIEFNFIANPLHPDFHRLLLGQPMSLRFDSRLAKP
jgi:RES domain-containing protein